MRVNIMRYLFSHTDFGQYELDFEGEGDDFFVINIFGRILSTITLSIYTPWYRANRFNFTINNISIYDGEKKVYLRSYLTGGDLFGVFIVNALIVVFTLGIGYPQGYSLLEFSYMKLLHSSNLFVYFSMAYLMLL